MILEGEQVIYTIGHSTRSADEFVQLLQDSSIDTLLDIRTIPRSRRNPQFNQDTLPATLAAASIAYEQLTALGGLRGKSRNVPVQTNAYWTNDSFHRYADYALGSEFAAGLQHLIDLSGTGCCAIMCAEAVWWRCHRRIVTDYLLARAITVRHILGPGQVRQANITPGAQIQDNGTIHYPAINESLPGPSL